MCIVEMHEQPMRHPLHHHSNEDYANHASDDENARMNKYHKPSWRKHLNGQGSGDSNSDVATTTLICDRFPTSSVA
jgi:hypothetical protein